VGALDDAPPDTSEKSAGLLLDEDEPAVVSENDGSGFLSNIPIRDSR
jgi:hypothetical protein